MLRSGLVAAIVLASVSQAMSADDPMLKLRMIVSAQVLQQYCPSAEIDSDAVRTVASSLGVRPSDMASGGRYHSALVEHAANLKAVMRIAGSDNAASACDRLAKNYGPEGSVLKGLARFR